MTPQLPCDSNAVVIVVVFLKPWSAIKREGLIITQVTNGGCHGLSRGLAARRQTLRPRWTFSKWQKLKCKLVTHTFRTSVIVLQHAFPFNKYLLGTFTLSTCFWSIASVQSLLSLGRALWLMFGNTSGKTAFIKATVVTDLGFRGLQKRFSHHPYDGHAQSLPGFRH